jgi:Uma2 family endonuclease
MVQETLKIPVKLAELEEAFGTEFPLRIPASFDEYLEWVEKCEFTVEYFNNEITIMGNVSYYHEKLVGRIIASFINALPRNYSVLGSNLKIHVPDVLSPDNFNADVSVVEDEPAFLILPSGKISTSNILNPVVVVEVTSKSTIAHDYGDKLMAYKKIASLKQVIFVSQYDNSITVYERRGPHHWELHDYQSLEDSFLVLGKTIQLKEIYD